MEIFYRISQWKRGMTRLTEDGVAHATSVPCAVALLRAVVFWEKYKIQNPDEYKRHLLRQRIYVGIEIEEIIL